MIVIDEAAEMTKEMWAYLDTVVKGKVMDEVPQERLVDAWDAWDEGFAHGYSKGNEEGLKIAFKDGYDFGVKTVSAKFAAEIEWLREALSEAIEFADQDYHALTPTGETMISRWRSALQQKEKE